ncbi:hypothetical protein CRUP_034535 [Coryphaenoides rupestris]|nr:hypothetical protein CRUP_034535 [Coryphaenoides rupestris]
MSKRVRNTDVCADCSLPDPRWASVNRGVLICDECCSVHRSLGRHSSQVRHLIHTPWPPNQLQMVQTLYSNGANSIWEHSLLDPASVLSGRRKAGLRTDCREGQHPAARGRKGRPGVAGRAADRVRLPTPGPRTPPARPPEAGHQELSERLVEIQYELTDRLAFYLCGRKPDHKNGQHFIVPQMADSLDLSELAKTAKKKLQSLSNHLFEELAMDVYDEVDRRETDAVWLATQNHSTLVTETTVVPFLPVNPDDAKRRQQGNSIVSPKGSVDLLMRGVRMGSSSEGPDADQPDYDSSLDSDLSDGPISMQEFQDVKNALCVSEAKIQQLMKVNTNLSDELRVMQKKLQSLQSENSSLRRQGPVSMYPAPADPPDPSSSSSPSGPSSGSKRRQSARVSGGGGSCGGGGRPMSMYETGSALKPYLSKGECPYPEEPLPTLTPFPPHASKMEKQSSVPDGDYDNAFNGSDVIRKTEQITKNIQELLRAAQDNKHHSFVPCSERIHVAVTEMAALFPKKPRSETVRGPLRLLTSSAYRLQGECRKAGPPNGSGPPGQDMQLVTQQVIQCAYDIAKAAKQLVTITTKENN